MSVLSVDMVRTIASDLGLKPAAVMAVAQVESPRGAFYPPNSRTPSGMDISGFPSILFEGHVFWRALKRQKPPYDPAKLLTRLDVKAAHGDISDILFEKWYKTRKYGTYNVQWDKLIRAREINWAAGSEACSWGAFQILGEGWPSMGYASIVEFVDSMYTIEGQAEAFKRFLMWKGLVPVIRAEDWKAFVTKYNGSGQVADYTTNLVREYAKAKALF